MARAQTNIGDVFCVKLDGIGKRYFQYVANDISMLNSSVIKVFKKIYTVDDNPEIKKIINDDIDFCAHVVLKWGLDKNLWGKVGNAGDVGSLEMLFRNTSDYGSKPGEQIQVSSNWYIWKINQPLKYIGKLNEEHKKAYVGIVINPLGIIELLKGNKYPPKYPD